MKKTIILWLVLAFVFSLYACGNSDSEIQEYKLGETAIFSDWAVTIVDFNYRELTEIESVGFGKVEGYCANVIVENIGKTARNFDYTQIKIDFDNGYLFDVFDARSVYKSESDGEIKYLYIEGVDDMNNSIPPLSTEHYFLSFDGDESMMNELDKPLVLSIAGVGKDGFGTNVVFQIDRTRTGTNALS